MLVSEYRTYISPTLSPNKAKVSLPFSKKEDFTLPLGKSFPVALSHRTYKPNYIKNHNYFANKERFGNPKSDLAELRRFKRLAQTKQLPKAYESVKTTLMDLTKVKKLSIDNRFKPYPALDESYKTLRFAQIKAQMSTTYLANDIYYKRIHAS